jgi:diadenosine tetraphosphatase ApaH/serine/threonine PP2A family protein phosphatase
VSTVALISDLHSNREALEAVFKRIDELEVPEVCCLGDVVGYGADPEFCVRLVADRCKWTIMGNHDWGLFHDLNDFNPLAREALVYTRKRLKPGLLAPRRKVMWNFLQGLPDRMEDHGHVYFHASPRDPIMEYVLKSDGFLEPEKMAEIFQMIDRPCFVGHTHWPGVHRPDFRFTQATDENREVALNGEPAVINVGSVGQPRDGDPRACFAVSDRGKVEFHRVRYDIRAAQTKIQKAGLHPALAERLARGK